MKEQSKGRILIISAALLWGLAGVCGKSIAWGSFSIAVFRGLIALIMIIAVKRKIKIELTRANFFGGVMVFLTGILYVAAIKRTTAGTAIVLQYIAPILVFLFEVVFRGKKAKLYEVLLCLMVFAGVVLSFYDSLDITKVAGNLLALLSGLTFAAQIIIMSGENSNSEDCTFIGCLLSVIVCFPFMFMDNNLIFDAHNILWIIIMGVFQYGLANICFAKGCKLIDDIECSLLLTIEPVFNPFPVMIICHEIMGKMAIIGGVLVVAAVTLYTVLSSRNQSKAPGST